MKAEKNISSKLLELLESKSANVLAPNEHELVIKEIGSLAEFERMRLTITELKQSMRAEKASLSLNPMIRQNLLSELSAKTSSAKKVFEYKIPAYQAVAACLAIILLVPLFYQKSGMPQIVEKTQYVTKVEYKTIKDTAIVYQRLKPHVLKATPSISIASIQKPNDTLAEVIAPQESEIYNSVKNLELIGLQKKGISNAEDSIAMNFYSKKQ